MLTGIEEVVIPTSANAFVISDLAGNANALSKLLQHVGFVPERDILISVGDLIDRGPNSAAVLEQFLSNENYHSVLGNHEWVLIDTAREADSATRKQKRENWARIGGQWGAALQQDALSTLAERIAKAFPCAIEIVFEGDDGPSIGITHGDYPFENWDRGAFASFDDDDYASMIWRRYRANDDPRYQFPTQGVAYTVHGHSRFDEPTLKHNALFIDTGDRHTPTIVNLRTLLTANNPELACYTIEEASCRTEQCQP